jgi:transcriptional regulator with XRE-family HTH domain
MNQQRHVIKRQTVEITIDRNNDVWSLQQRISRMISAQIIPLINRHCSEMSSPHHIHRIDQLELDLGELDPDNVETDFASKFSDALRRELAEQINRLESDALSRHSSSAIASHLELFSLFVRQGLLPWWADFQQAKLPENSLDYLLQEAPDALRRLLLELVRDKYALQRLICHFNDSRLLSLVELAIPTLSDFPAFLYEALIAAGGNTLMQLSGVPPSRWREQLWQTIMQTAVLANPPDRLSLFRGITTRWATALGLSHADLLENLLQGLLSKESSISDYLAITISEKPKQTISFDAEWLTLLAILNEYLPETLKSSLLTPLEAAYQSNNSAVMLAKLESWLKTHNTDLLTVLKDSLPEPLQQSLVMQLETAHQSNDSAAMLAELESWLKTHNTDLLTVLKDSLPEPLQQSLVMQLETAHQSNDSAAMLAELESWLKTHNTDLLTVLKDSLPEPLQQSLVMQLETAHQSNDSAAMLAELESWLKTHNTDLLTVLKDSLPEPLQQSLLTRLKTAHQSNDSAVILAELEAWISMHDSELPAAILLRLAVFHQRLHLAKNATSTPALLAKQATLRKTSDSRLNDVDELYIDNAGLVILWPFLNHFFERLDLIQERDFLNDDSKQRALALLQYLANEDPGSPEYQLPLNKLLCGMELEAVFHLATPLTETEKDECNSFLAAVIEQAPILNKMSISGFRGSFLLRQGILSPRDGAWLLRIERETYDVVLDRFPWEMDWVKLPWMSTSLRVEW